MSFFSFFFLFEIRDFLWSPSLSPYRNGTTCHHACNLNTKLSVTPVYIAEAIGVAVNGDAVY